MQIVVQVQGLEVDEAFRQKIKDRIESALGWADSHVRRVSVHLSDINGPRGGEDKRCQIQMTIPGAADVIIQNIASDLYLAVDRAADRARYTLARRVERQRQHRADSLGVATIKAFCHMSMLRRKAA